MMKRTLAVLSLFCLLFSFCSCSSPAVFDSSKLQIVTTNFPSYDFARQMAGDRAEVTMLLAPGEESHSFEPTPQDVIRLTKADLFILGGGESDQWALKLLESAELDESKTLMMMDCVEAVPEEITEGMQHHDEHEDENQDHSRFYEYDEHVWTSPANAAAICTAIAERLSATDKDNAHEYMKHLDSYLNELSALDILFTDIVSNSARKTIIFADRFPFRYFADQYGLTYYAAFPGCSSEAEPDAATMKFLIDKVTEESIPSVFYTELSNRKIADAVCEATGAKQLLFHSCHTVAKDEFERGETYVSLMKQNAVALKEALS